MFNIGKKIKYKFFIAGTIVFVFQASVFASFEVVNAVTVEPEVEAEVQENKYIPTYNDPDLPDFSQDTSVASYLEKKLVQLIKKRKKKKNIIEIQDQTENDKPVNNDDTSITNGSFSPKIDENVVVDNKNKFSINADKVSYDDTTGNFSAIGNVVITSHEQGISLEANEAFFNKVEQNLKLYGNVKVIKSGVEMLGEYMLVDLNEQNILMDNPLLEAYSFKINAQEGFLVENEIEIINGTLTSNKNSEIVLQTSGFQSYDNIKTQYLNYRRDVTLRQATNDNRNQHYKIDAKEIVYTSYKDHNSLSLKKADVFYNKHKILRNTDIEVISDKESKVSEMNGIEAGNLKNFGMYIGYGFVNKMPKGHILKLLPAFVYGDSNIGIGLIGRYHSRNSVLEAGYASSTTNLVARGKYKFSDNLDFVYGRNAYIPEGFMGARRSGYAAQLEYKKSFKVEDLDAYFNNAVYAGIFSEYQKHDQENAYATTRFRYLAELRKDFLKYENKEQDLKINFSGLAQSAATLYGDGSTNAVVRIGPFVTTKLKWWESSLGYMFGGTYGDSPFVFDKYRYGKSSIMLNERLNINDKFAFGFRAVVSPLKDNYEEDLLTESRLYAIFGPEDLKLALSYDFVRAIAHLEFMILLGTSSSKINFERFHTVNADNRKQKQDFYKNTHTALDSDVL